MMKLINKDIKKGPTTQYIKCGHPSTRPNKYVTNFHMNQYNDI